MAGDIRETITEARRRIARARTTIAGMSPDPGSTDAMRRHNANHQLNAALAQLDALSRGLEEFAANLIDSMRPAS